MTEHKQFFSYVAPSVLAFALSGVYAIVDGLFVGNSVGDLGLSTINLAYPVTALIQAVGTGIGMGGAVRFSICRAEGKEDAARHAAAGTLWLLGLASLILTGALSFSTTAVLRLLGAQGELLRLGKGYLELIAWGASLQIVGTGLVPLVRNRGGAAYAMCTMIAGFLVNMGLDYLFVWVYGWSTPGAALATLVGQGVTAAGGLAYLFKSGLFTLRLPLKTAGQLWGQILRTGAAPFGITLTPNLSLVLINRFSAFYGGEEAIACYACISYVISIVYLVLQGVGDGSQPLMSRCYGRRAEHELKRTRARAYALALALAAASAAGLFAARHGVGNLLGASALVQGQVAAVFPVFLLAVPFVAVSRITAASFYAAEKNAFSYLVIYAEPAAMLLLLLVLPLFGGQGMIWWSAALAQMLAALVAVLLKRRTDRRAPPCTAAL